MDEAFKPYDGDAAVGNPLSLDEELFVYRLRVDVSTNPKMWAAYKTKLGMPTCPAIEAFTTRLVEPAPHRTDGDTPTNRGGPSRRRGARAQRVIAPMAPRHLRGA